MIKFELLDIIWTQFNWFHREELKSSLKFGSKELIKSRFDHDKRQFVDLDRLDCLSLILPLHIKLREKSFLKPTKSYSKLKSNSYQLFPMLKDCEFSKEIVSMLSEFLSFSLPFIFSFCVEMWSHCLLSVKHSFQVAKIIIPKTMWHNVIEVVYNKNFSWTLLFGAFLDLSKILIIHWI